jgi:Tfp pilus assembly protein PilW
MNSQIKLTTLRISATQSKITTLTDEIDKLETEVVRLESILNDRLALLLKRIPASYKRSSVSDFGSLLFSKNIFDFITRIKYVQMVQAEDAALVFQVKATQNSYNDSKKIREDKKSQLEEIKAQLNQQNAQLASQKLEKDALLTATQGNESRYEQLLSAARAQLAAINNFVTSAGGAGILSNQTYHSDWGDYYNQRDSQWANHGIGSSSESIASVGCLVTSLSMVITHYGKSVTPVDVASTPELFFSGTAYMYQGTHTVAGAFVTRTPISISTGSIDGELAQGHPVIVGVYNGPAHFVVLKSGSGGNYMMNDPFVENGHDIAFTSRYSMGAISEVDSVRVN